MPRKLVLLCHQLEFDSSFDRWGGGGWDHGETLSCPQHVSERETHHKVTARSLTSVRWCSLWNYAVTGNVLSENLLTFFSWGDKAAAVFRHRKTCRELKAKKLRWAVKRAAGTEVELCSRRYWLHFCIKCSENVSDTFGGSPNPQPQLQSCVNLRKVNQLKRFGRSDLQAQHPFWASPGGIVIPQAPHFSSPFVLRGLIFTKGKLCSISPEHKRN